MKLVVDANVLFAALLKNGWTRQVWVSPNIQLVAPRYLLAEFESKRRVLLSKFKPGTELEFDGVATRLLSYVRWVENAQTDPFLGAAQSLVSDPDDLDYLACALYSGADLWTSDKGFSNQKRVRVWTTAQLVELLGPAP